MTIDAHKPPRTACERNGNRHAWEPTTAPDWRQCTGSDCRKVQRHLNGEWVDVPRAARPRQDTRVQELPSLWG